MSEITYISDGQHREQALHRSRRAQQMADRAFGAANIDLGRLSLALGPVQHQRFDGAVLGRVAQRRRGCVSVDVIDPGRR